MTQSGPGTIEGIRDAIERAPKTVATEAAAVAAPLITGLAGASWDRGANVYGTTFPRSKWDGHRLTLRKDGKARADAKFVNHGTMLRFHSGLPYIGYLIGNYKILPPGNTYASLPVAWKAALARSLEGVTI
jgi:hypothetical protein